MNQDSTHLQASSVVAILLTHSACVLEVPRPRQAQSPSLEVPVEWGKG